MYVPFDNIRLTPNNYHSLNKLQITLKCMKLSVKNSPARDSQSKRKGTGGNPRPFTRARAPAPHIPNLVHVAHAAAVSAGAGWSFLLFGNLGDQGFGG
jgi:hypothetical protein